MEMNNHSAIAEFILVGLSSAPEQQIIIFWAFAFIYAVALAGNFLLILAIGTCSKLHTPMYFLLVNLSIVNMCSISITVPKMLQNLLTAQKTISFSACIVQVFLFVWALGTEILLLSFMAFDRYAAICQPLHYMVIMKKEVCIGIAAGVWIMGMVNSAVHAGLLLKLTFCSSHIMNHFFCDLPPLWKLSCSDISLNETMAFSADVTFTMSSCALTFISYLLILRTIFTIQSVKGKKKAFSTCSSHLLVVSFYFSTIIYTYAKPSSANDLEEYKSVAIIYSVVTPVLNPIIYSLRNKEVKEALAKLICRIWSSQHE
ncbi:olfactory receptor 13G1-like [Hemicordylus capensis]|uniref:olfactory receptor 13G1-like n=1 Tax=Hemicordylus capensis TaxID=884348 RepID=UPI0023028A0E|nr:olfactory receptor 13G1-like [Hemicordylus capensis]